MIHTVRVRPSIFNLLVLLVVSLRFLPSPVQTTQQGRSAPVSNEYRAPPPRNVLSGVDVNGVNGGSADTAILGNAADPGNPAAAGDNAANPQPSVSDEMNGGDDASVPVDASDEVDASFPVEPLTAMISSAALVLTPNLLLSQQLTMLLAVNKVLRSDRGLST